jgi:hypothetical protein
MSELRSVTTILDAYQEPFLWEWKLKVGKAKAERISKEARQIGTEVDQLIQDDIQGKGYQLEGRPDAVVSCLKGWEAFKVKYPEYVKEIEGIQVELTQDGIVGHPDIVHKLEINDIKSGNSLTLRPKYVIQASKYALMKEKNRAAILLLSKTNGNGNYLYVWWDGELLRYFGETVFNAFRTIFEYEEMVSRMVLDYMEKETLGNVT